MSPTILRLKGYRFYFLSNEENRMHIHIVSANGEAKFWLEPIISLAAYYKLNSKELNKIHKIVEEHKNEFIKKWKKHFGIR